MNLFDWNYWLVIINTKPLLVWGHWIIAKTNIRKYKNSVLYMPSLFLSCRCALCDYVVPIIRCVYEEAFHPLYLPVYSSHIIWYKWFQYECGMSHICMQVIDQATVCSILLSTSDHQPQHIYCYLSYHYYCVLFLFVKPLLEKIKAT